ncbi:purple acid phosphatase family protein [Wocania ichthyoenteri]|uniref:purple acid phosphatase family protein n=1 Tax=Wocania ichthyoenteri TaxID=1230531 RepID=UPI0009DFF584|nr:metallophosphoesterase family protein [Wocania ichthyoenteri]
MSKSTLFSAMLLVILLSSCKVTHRQAVRSILIEAYGEKPTLLRQPYLQMVRPTTVTVTWKTDTIVEKCQVEFYEANKAKKSLVTGTLISHEGSIFNEVVIKNLNPKTTYYYNIYSNGYLLAGGKDYYFKTSPNNTKTAFNFYALGDIGDVLPKSFAKEPANRITELKIKPDFGLGLGDIVYPKGESSMYDSQLFKPFEKVFKNTPFYPVVGNHDWRSDPEKNFEKEWSLPGNEHYFYFTYSNALFIGLDSHNGGLYNREEQVAWLKETLKEQKVKYDWIIVYLHHNGKTCTYKKDYEHVMNLYQIFTSNNVDLVLNGHAHTYERLKPFDANGNVDVNASIDHSSYGHLKDRFISITIGAGGKINERWHADPTNQKNCKDGNIVAHAEHVPSFGVFSIDGKTLKLNAYNSFTGEIFDTFTIEK